MRDTLGVEEFFNEVLYLVSRKVVSEEYIQSNAPFFNDFIVDLYPSYLEGASIKSLSDIVESVAYNIFEHKPSLYKI